MSCSDQIVPIATNIIKLLLQLPSEEIFEEIKVPVQTIAESSVSVSYVTQKRTRRGLVRRHESMTNFLSSAQRVGSILMEHYGITVLAQGGGSTLAAWVPGTSRGEAAAIEAEDVISLNGERVWKVAEPKNGKDFLIPLEGPVRAV
jgi:hypothetical protein